MSGNSFGTLFVVTTFGESHGRALGCIVDGCPPGLPLDEADIQSDLDRRRPGRSRHTTQRNEPDQVQILSGVFEGRTTGTPIGLVIFNQDQRSKDYGEIAQKFRPGQQQGGAKYSCHHADADTEEQKNNKGCQGKVPAAKWRCPHVDIIERG